MLSKWIYEFKELGDSAFTDRKRTKIKKYFMKTREGIVLSTIDKAIDNENQKNGFIVHTDRGSQDTGHKFRNRVLSSRGIISPIA